MKPVHTAITSAVQICSIFHLQSLKNTFIALITFFISSYNVLALSLRNCNISRKRAHGGHCLCKGMVSLLLAAKGYSIFCEYLNLLLIIGDALPSYFSAVQFVFRLLHFLCFVLSLTLYASSCLLTSLTSNVHWECSTRPNKPWVSSLGMCSMPSPSSSHTAETCFRPHAPWTFSLVHETPAFWCGWKVQTHQPALLR